MTSSTKFKSMQLLFYPLKKITFDPLDRTLLAESDSGGAVRVWGGRGRGGRRRPGRGGPHGHPRAVPLVNRVHARKVRD